MTRHGLSVAERVGSSGDLHLGGVSLACVEGDHAFGRQLGLGQRLGRVEPPNGALDDSQMTAVAFSTFLYRFAAAVRSRPAANGDPTGLFVVLKCFQYAFGKS